MIGNMSWGMYKFRGDLMQNFLKEGHQVVVIAPEDEWSIEIKRFGCTFVDLKLDRKGLNPFLDLKYLVQLTQKLIELRPDIVLTYTIKPVIYGTLASRLAQVPLRFAITTGLGHTFSKNNWVSYVTKRLYRFCLKFSTETWFLNTQDRETFLKAKLVSEKKTYVLPGEGINTDFYHPRSKETVTLTFSLIGRMLWDKGVEIFVEAARKIKIHHPEINFLVAGPIDPGNPESIPIEKLQEWNKEGAITYLGPITDVREILKETSALIHPTYYMEGLPRILMEAGSMEVPCITTDIPGCRDVIKNRKNGFLVKARDVQSLSSAIVEFLGLSEEERREWGKVGRECMVDHFSNEIVFKIYKEKLDL